jgi:hypothetical protein
MQRITEIEKREEAKMKSHLVIDRESSARIIKRSLWQNALKKSEKPPAIHPIHATPNTEVNLDNLQIDDEPTVKKLKF